MFITTKALVLRETKYKEADRIVSLLTADKGLITAKARGALRKGSKMSAATQQLTYSELTMFFNKGKWSINEAVVVEAFEGLRTNIEALALGSYFSECTESFSVEDQPEAQVLQLILNSLYALSREMYDFRLIKAAFELRLMSLVGYRPDLNICPVCGCDEPDRPVFDLDEGRVYCKKCSKLGNTVQLDKQALSAMRYILSAPAKQLFSFEVDKPGKNTLAFTAERYILKQAERGFSTLDYYKQFANLSN